MTPFRLPFGDIPEAFPFAHGVEIRLLLHVFAWTAC